MNRKDEVFSLWWDDARRCTWMMKRQGYRRRMYLMRRRYPWRTATNWRIMCKSEFKELIEKFRPYQMYCCGCLEKSGYFVPRDNGAWILWLDISGLSLTDYKHFISAQHWGISSVSHSKFLDRPNIFFRAWLTNVTSQTADTLPLT
jgi:hypothetical protein